MNKTITCKQCASSFQATDEQQAFILASRRKGMRFIMLRCANCAHYTELEPFDGVSDGVGARTVFTDVENRDLYGGQGKSFTNPLRQ